MKIDIWCDGSCKENGGAGACGGWAAAIYVNDIYLNTIYGAERHSTNQRMELIAAINGIQQALQSLNGESFFMCMIHSDSAYLVRCYNENWYSKWERNGWENSSHGPVANRELWEALIPYFQDSRFYFEKVKGHSGVTKNENVDAIAQNTAEQLRCGEIEDGYTNMVC